MELRIESPMSRVVHIILWVSSLLHMVEALEEGYDVFHIPPVLSISPGQNALHHHGHHLFPWQQSPEVTDRDLVNGGLRLKLIHRDDRNSLLTTASTYGAEAKGRARSRLDRDIARVRSLNEKVIELTSAAIASTPGPLLRSPVFSGLDQGSGEYFTRLSFGSPSTDVLVTIDTGSELLWIQCHPCDNCYDQVGPIFNPGKSETYDPVHCSSRACQSLSRSKCEGAACQYDVNYGDGSFTTGDFATETLTMNSTKGKPFKIQDFYFGCGHDNEGLFIASGGLLGLGRGDFSFASQISKVLNTPKFSYCLMDRFTTNDKDSRPSYLYFGGPEVSHMHYTPLLQNPFAPTFYYVQLKSISVAKKVLEIPTSTFEMDAAGRGGVILDSGTSVTRLHTLAYQAMRDEFRSKARNLKSVQVPGQDLFDTCFEITQDAEVPLITLHLANDVDLVLPADNVLIPVDDSGSLFCLAFAGSDGRSNLSIIGNIQQQGFRIEFDSSSKSRVGITKEDCSFN